MYKKETQDAILKIQNLTVQTAAEPELEQIRIALYPREIHAIVGLSSVDLQNMLRLFAGKFSNYSGTIFYRGTPCSFRRQKIVDACGEKHGAFQQMSVTDNLLLKKVQIFRMNKRAERHTVQQLLDQFLLPIDAGQRFSELSEEEQLLLMALRSYLSDRPVVVFYDLMEGLRPQAQEIFLNILNHIRQQDRAVVYLTTHLEDAFCLADRISAIGRRTICLTKPLEEAVAAPKEFLYAMLDWKILGNMGSVDASEALRSIVNARSFAVSGLELKKEFIYFASDILKVLHADRCVICLVDLTTGVVTNAFQNQDTVSADCPENDSIVCDLIRQGHFKTINRHTPVLSKLFLHHDGMNQLLCVPINRGDEVSALLMVFYREPHKLCETEEYYLDAFGKEIAIALETSDLHGKSTLLQESHHRIKNNLQMIISLVYMQKKAVQHGETDVNTAFDAITRQISSIAAVHNLLATDKKGGSIINLAAIIRELAEFYSARNTSIQLELEDISVPYNKATSIAIVVNELLANSVKHAFEKIPGRENKIHVSVFNDGLNIHIIISDNGCGFPEGETEPRGGGIGMLLVRTIVAASNGQVLCANDHGAVTTVLIPVSRFYDAKNGSI